MITMSHKIVFLDLEQIDSLLFLNNRPPLNVFVFENSTALQWHLMQRKWEREHTPIDKRKDNDII